ncbi:unnamed protein product [Cylicocyclus nassatus]|uniref:Uncharacterized protein n=1 Tax=Cylicocyclus nassatus TaxID=53992 RepID=A0AA36DP22_CYLNA|nr:unnamed protein product [Cylicocyclus nassatus]
MPTLQSFRLESQICSIPQQVSSSTVFPSSQLRIVYNQLEIYAGNLFQKISTQPKYFRPPCLRTVADRMRINAFRKGSKSYIQHLQGDE